jgi:hypothetical protein
MFSKTNNTSNKSDISSITQLYNIINLEINNKLYNGGDDYDHDEEELLYYL